MVLECSYIQDIESNYESDAKVTRINWFVHHGINSRVGHDYHNYETIINFRVGVENIWKILKSENPSVKPYKRFCLRLGCLGRVIFTGKARYSGSSPARAG